MKDVGVDFEINENELLLHPRGRLDRNTVNRLWQNTKGKIEETEAARITIDLQAVRGLDSSGVVYLNSIEMLCRDAGFDYSEQNVPENVGEFIRYTRQHSSLPEKGEGPSEPALGNIEAAGMKLQAQGRQLHRFLEFSGRFFIAVLGRIRHPKKFHLNEVLYQLQEAGVNSLPLICALSFLLGMLMVFQGSSRNIGPDILVANVVIIAVSRQMAPFLVAVVVAGRSGSAFASEIGTMKVNQELEALEVMNIDITRFIVVPRVAALALAEPILTMFANLVGVLGGLVTAVVYLDVPVLGFLHEARDALRATDIYTGLVKAFTTGVLTGYIACFSGLQAGRESGSVGIQTTSAVVTSIFAVVAVDTAYSYIFTTLGW